MSNEHETKASFKHWEAKALAKEDTNSDIDQFRQLAFFWSNIQSEYKAMNAPARKEFIAAFMRMIGPMNYVADDEVYPQAVVIGGRKISIVNREGRTFLDVEAVRHP
jgi:hypothetical protein